MRGEANAGREGLQRSGPRRATRLRGVACLAALLAAAGAVLADDRPLAYGEPRRLALASCPDLDESSGVAASRTCPGALWTHNDSGDRPRLFLLDREGQERARVTLAGAEAVDWEDMCSFEREGRPWLLVADVGDNGAVRPSVALYLLPEPDPARLRGEPVPAHRIEVRYPDGPRDCEGVAVDPVEAAVYLVTKERDLLRAPRVYRLPLAGFPRPRGGTLEPVAELRGLPPLVTALDISPDGRRAVVLGYGDAHEYVRQGEAGWAAAFACAPRRVKMPRRAQGESICYDLAGRALLLTSEGSPMPLWEVAPAE